MIDAKNAAQIAARYYQDISGRNADNLTIEEVELDEENDCWFITLGIIDSNQLMFRPSSASPSQYKIFKISREDGQVKSMKIRTLK